MFEPARERSKIGNAFKLNEASIPNHIRTALDLMAKNFNTSLARNMNIMESSALYGLISHYESDNFCWIHPTTIRTMTADPVYDAYLRRINKYARLDKLQPYENIEVGDDCIVKYDKDNNWYRGIIVNEIDPKKWLVFFLDYGDFQVSHVSKIASPILDRDCGHYQAPVQGVCCRLYNILPKTEATRNEVDNRLKRFYLDNTENFLQVIVRNIRTDFIVDCDLFLIDDSQVGDRKLYRRHIAQTIVDDGLATFADPLSAHSIKLKRGK